MYHSSLRDLIFRRRRIRRDKSLRTFTRTAWCDMLLKFGNWCFHCSHGSQPIVLTTEIYIKTPVRGELLETELLGTVSWNSRLSLTNCYRMRRAELGCTSKINLIRNTPLSRPLLIWIVSLATVSLSPLFLSLSLFLEVHGEFVFIWLSHYSTLTSENLPCYPLLHACSGVA